MEVGKSTGGGEASSSSKPATVCYSYGGRLVFDIELAPGETTIVSWKKLLRDANKAKPPPAPAVSASAAPSLPFSAAQPIPVVDQVNKSKPEDAPPSNRFSAVVEKIERLYVGKQSCDEEELDDVPDDDQYDTEDSFIDDTELDAYFQVDKATTKHNGFFVNKGKLEQMDEPTLLVNHQQKRQRKKREKPVEDKGDDCGPNKHLKLGHARMKVASRTAPFVGRSSNSQSSVAIECFPDGEPQHSLSAPMGSLTNKPADCGIKTDHSSYSRMSTRDDSVFPLKTDNGETQKTGITQSNAKDATEFSDARYQNQEKKAVKQFQTAAKRLTGDNDEPELSIKKRKDKNSSDKLPDLNLPVSNDLIQQPVENTAMNVKDVPSIKPKGTMLERAIRELEKVVAECEFPARPQKMEVEDTDTSPMAIKRRLPREVKQKLAKVARLAQSSQGRISEELINRLMSILGHLVQLRTLKRNLREMVLLGLSAKREKADRFQQIKTEVLEMIRLQGHSKSTQDGATGDFQLELGAVDKEVLKGKSSIDTAIEDKMCDLYDLYVQGMDEDKGPQMRKLYIELAELWPNGYMDNSGIKSAVERAKERRRELQNREKVDEKARRKNLPLPKPDMVRGESGSTDQSRALQGPTNSSTLASSSRMISNTDTTQQLTSQVNLSDQSLIISHTDLPREEKLENLTFPMLKEQMKQQHREVEKRAKKLSLKPEKVTQKPHKQHTAPGHMDDPSNQH